MRTATCTLIILTCLFVLLSCSDGSNATNPPLKEKLRTEAGTVPAGRVCWGMWDITINRETGEVESVPLRGVEFMANVVNFLQPPSAPVNLLTVKIDPDESLLPAGKVTCDISLKHPFPGTRFCGFDVMGIVMGNWDAYQFESDNQINTSLLPGSLLQNPDGYTRWWNQAEFTSYGTLFGYIEGAKANHSWTSTHTLNPFKYFCDELGAFDPFNPSVEERGFFSSADPGINTRRYYLQFYGAGGVFFHFKYAVSASWVAPYGSAVPPFTCDDFPPDANIPEAFRIGIMNVGSTAYYIDETNNGGNLSLYIDIRDWQLDGSLSTIKDEIHSVIVESPMLFPDPVELDTENVIVNPGNQSSAWIPFSVENVTPTGLENQLLLITVKSNTVTTYEPQIPGITGFDYPDGHLASYAIIPAPIKDIAPLNSPPVADASASSPVSGPAPLAVDLDPSLSYDPDGVITLYEWDFENDGSYDVSTPGPDIVPHVFEAGTHEVMLRVTDDDGADDTDLLEITAEMVEDPSWRMYNKDHERTAHSPVVGPQTYNVKYTWAKPDIGRINSSIAVDSEMRAVFASTDGNLYCVNPDGTLAWEYYIGALTSSYFCSPAVGLDDTIYMGNTNCTLFRLAPTGDLIWSKNFNYGAIDGGLSVTDDGCAIFTTHYGHVVKVDLAGDELWNYPCGSLIYWGHSVGPNGNVYVSDTGNMITALTSGGDLLWSKSIGAGGYCAVPVLDPTGIYVGSHDGNLYCVDYDGEVVWQQNVGMTIHSSAAVGSDGNVYVGSYYGDIYSINKITGDVNWIYSSSGNYFACGVILDGNNNVYAGNQSGEILCVSPDGTQVWSYMGGYPITSLGPAIAPDGTLILGNSNNSVIAFHD